MIYTKTMDYQEGLIDLEATNERLYELYLEVCKRHNQKTSIKDFLVWVEENYA